MSVSLDRSSIDNAADENSKKTEQVIKFGEWKREQREEQRKIRDRNNSIRTNQPEMVKYLKGEMNEKTKKLWEQFISKNLSKEETVALANAAKNGQLMSTKSKEWQTQQMRLNQLLDAAFAKDRQQKLQKAQLDESENVKEIKENLKKKRLR